MPTYMSLMPTPSVLATRSPSESVIDEGAALRAIDAIADAVRPPDIQIISLIGSHYNVSRNTVYRWLREMDLYDAVDEPAA